MVFPQETNGNKKLAVETTRQSHASEKSVSLVAIDIYAQDSKEYMTACLMTAFVQTPILFCISNLLDGPEHWSPYTVVAFLSGLQFVAIAFFFWSRGLKACDVKQGSWTLLMIRSVIYAIAINMFVYSLERLNPASALMALHSGVIATTVLIRVFMREHLHLTLVVVKVCQIAFFIELCLIPGFATVKTDKFDKQYSMGDYWFDLGIGLGAGMLLGVVSRITSAMCGAGMLIHESYMTFWASLMTLILAPFFFGAYIYNTGNKIKTDMTME